MKLTKLTLTALACLGVSSSAFATNSMNPISFDARSVGMGGADTALGLSTLAMGTNPAGITDIGTRADLNLSLLMPSLSLSDELVGPQAMPLNTDHDAESSVFPLFGVGFSTEVADNLFAGISFFVQGGAGADFKGLNTFADDDPTTDLTTQPSPATYDLHSQVMYFKFAPTIAYDLGAVALGASLHLGMSKLEWSHGAMQFPEQDADHVYVPHDLDYTSDWSLGASGRFGILVKLLDDDLRFGVSYMFGVKPTYEGTLKLDKQLEYAMSTDDFGWAGELAFGVAGRLLDKRLVLSADIKFAQWQSAVDIVTFTGSATGQAPAGMEQLQLPFQMKWEDQIVIAFGVEYAVLPDTLFVRAGYNYGASPVTSTGINPLFPPISEHHLTFGLGLNKIAGGLGLDLAAELVLNNEVESDETNQMAFEPTMPPATPSPNGYRFAVSMSQLNIHLMAHYDF